MGPQPGLKHETPVTGDARKHSILPQAEGDGSFMRASCKLAAAAAAAGRGSGGAGTGRGYSHRACQTKALRWPKGCWQ